MKTTTTWLLKAAGVWLSLFAVDLAIALLPQSAGAGNGHGLMDGLVVMALVAGAFALLLAALAARLPLPFWRKALTIFIVFYVTNSLLSEIEAFFFNGALHMTPLAFFAMARDGVGRAAVVALSCAALWRSEAPVAPVVLRGLVWKAPLIVVIYMFFYVAAGACVMASKAVQAYYAHGVHINMTTLLGLQVARGAIWAGLVWILVKGLDASNMTKAVLTGLSFAVFMSLVLFYPNPLMPWAVRRMHLLEIFSSNLLFGISAALIMASGSRRAGA